jgi:fimbrial chaperone protein
MSILRNPRHAVPPLRRVPLVGMTAFRVLALVLAIAGASIPLPATAGEYAVSPLRIELDRDTRSGAVTLTNSGADRMDFQISVMEWTQDAEGRDRYTPTSEVVFFPKILTLQPSESRVVRAGVQTVPVATERTFRLFIEPIPTTAREPLPPGASIAVTLRFALPVFVKPPKRESAGEIENAGMSKGAATFTIRNTGNEHLKFEDGVSVVGRDAQGAEVFKERIESRYVLAGVARRTSATIPASACMHLATLEITARAEQFTLSRKLDVNRTHCE